MNDGALRAVKKLYTRLCAARDTTTMPIPRFNQDKKALFILLCRFTSRTLPPCHDFKFPPEVRSIIWGFALINRELSICLLWSER
jgi:hypothetical protein